MIHTITNKEDSTELNIEFHNVGKLLSLNIYSSLEKYGSSIYITQKELNDLIGILLHIQSKSRK
jgi:hypothetical protein